MKKKYILFVIIIIFISNIIIKSYGMYKYTFKIDAYNLNLNTEHLEPNYENNNNNNILNINKNDSEHSITNTNEKDSIIDLYVIKKYQ